MFPEKRTALLGMAFETRRVDRLPGEHRVRGAAMRDVASGAVHLAVGDRVRIGTQRLRTLPGMTRKADFRLRRRLEYRVAAYVYVVAVAAGNFGHVMRARMPAPGRALPVAFEAHRIVLGDRCRGSRGKVGHRRAFLSPAYPPRVLPARTVTGLALQLPFAEWAVGICGYSMRCPKYAHQRRIIMTGDAAVRPASAVAHILTAARLRQGRGR